MGPPRFIVRYVVPAALGASVVHMIEPAIEHDRPDWSVPMIESRSLSRHLPEPEEVPPSIGGVDPTLTVLSGVAHHSVTTLYIGQYAPPTSWLEFS